MARANAKDLTEIKFGIEIEMVRPGGNSRWHALDCVKTVFGGSLTGSNRCRDDAGRVWKAVGDSSIRGAGAVELVSPPLYYADIPKLQEVVRQLRASGFKVNASCGIHVHVDGAVLDAQAVRVLVKAIHRMEPMLWKALQINSRRRDSWARDLNARFIRKIEGRGCRTLDTLRRAWYSSGSGRDYYGHGDGSSRDRAGYHYDSSRYSGVNLHSLFYRGTVEFRYFDSTLHAGKVRAYVSLCLALAAYATRARSTRAARRSTENMNAGTAWYWFLWYQLRLKGEEFKAVRQHLTAAFPPEEMRRRRPNRNADPAATAMVAAL